ncbi:MAG: glycosyltransferase family 4 protein [Gemmiger sp.]|nr:glycosyltransferase family 4 protein [Gemmiger sp.]
MTICFFSAQYLPTVGGVERYTWNLARRAVAAGHRAIVVTSALPGLPLHETDPDGIVIYRLPVWQVMGGRFPVLRPGRDFAGISRQLWAQKMDLCVVQTRMYTESIWAARKARKNGVKTIVIDHSTGYMPVGGGLVGACGRLYEHLACGLIRATKPDFYGVSAAVCRWLANFSVTPAGCLPNAVDPAALAAEAAAAPPTDWRKALGLAPGAPLVAYVGRLIPEKGAAPLAEAVAGMPGVGLVVAGEGPLLATLRQNLPKNIACPGSLPHPETAQLLCQADVYCLPTRYAEGFPTTLLEAAACHCAIVCTPTAGTEELLPGPGYGLFVDSTTPQAIRAALQTLLADEPLRRRCAEATYQNLCGRFTWDAVFAKIQEIANT